jgi:CheY-like chemotaxis protein
MSTVYVAIENLDEVERRIREFFDKVNSVLRVVPEWLSYLIQPVLDGMETTRRIKQRWPEVRVVALTMYAECREGAMAAGADAFLVKGAPLLELLKAVLEFKEST